MLARLKEKIQTMLAFEAGVAHRMGLNPNVVSVIGAALAFLSAVSYTQWKNNSLFLLLAAALLLLSGFCDALDGVIARLYQQTTLFGGFLDSLLDRYADSAIYVALIASQLCDLCWGLAALIGSLLVSYSRARAEAECLKMEAVGLAERAERILIVAVSSVVACLYQSPSTVMNWATILLGILTNLSVLQRVMFAYSKLKKREKSL